MPELPEVETVASELRSLIIGKTISRVQIFWQKTWQEQNPVLPLTGQTITAIERKGKFIIIHLSVSYLVVHLRMTGQLLFRNNGESEEDNKHIHVKLFFNDETALFFKDTRKFGRIIHTGNPGPVLGRLGWDALNPTLTPAQFRKLLDQKKMNIKAFLLSQAYIAGLGNIYADESLFRAGIHPASMTHKIPLKRIGLLFETIQDVLNQAIRNMGSTISDYRDSFGNSGKNQYFFKVYQRQGETCQQCSSLIRKTRVAGRGTHFCPGCQKIYR